MSKFPPQDTSSSEEDNYLTAINSAYSEFVHPTVIYDTCNYPAESYLDDISNTNNQYQEESLFEEQSNLGVDIIATNNQTTVNSDISQGYYPSEIPQDIHSTCACDVSLSPTTSITDIGQLQVTSNSLPIRYRSPTEIRNCRKSTLPVDLPYGPWDSADQAKCSLNTWANDYSTSGGRFALNTQSSYRATTRRGEQKLLVCNRFGKPRTNCEVRHSLSLKCDCPCFIRIEHSSNGWIVAEGFFAHNHELVQNNSESIAQAALRTIPDELESLGQMLKRAGFSASKSTKPWKVKLTSVV